jgi:hypothetical protein
VSRSTATFDLLRERLAKSTVDFMDGDSFLQELRELKSSKGLAVTSTPFRTLQMPSHLQSQSSQSRLLTRQVYRLTLFQILWINILICITR